MCWLSVRYGHLGHKPFLKLRNAIEASLYIWLRASTAKLKQHGAASFMASRRHRREADAKPCSIFTGPTMKWRRHRAIALGPHGQTRKTLCNNVWGLKGYWSEQVQCCVAPRRDIDEKLGNCVLVHEGKLSHRCTTTFGAKR